jgi:NhaP-type Na+/H+ or K+/H+ antiporter
MTAWWSPQATPHVIPPLCVVCAVAGAALGKYASLGRRRAIVVGGWIGIIVLYGLTGIAGVIGLMTGQPEYVWVPLTITGIVISVVFGITMRPVLKEHARAELRRSIARDL